MTRELRLRTLAAMLSMAVIVAMTACGREGAEEVESEAVVPVKTAPARLGAIRGLVHATGVVGPAPGAELVVVAPEGARIAEIPRAAGDRVEKGDVLVRFEIPSLTADVERQQAEVTRAQATLATAKAAETRAGELFDRGVAARKDVEDSHRAVADAEAMLAQARASLSAAQAVAGRATVRASFNGIITRRQHNPGDLVEPSAGDPVLQVVDPGRLEVVASIALADASRVAVGAAAHLVGTGTNATNILKVLSRPAAVESGTATIPVRLGFAGPANMPVGTPVQVDIDAEHRTNVVLIPAIAVVREGEETAVFVVSGETAQRRAVRIGLTDETNVEIVSGVAAGDMVIVDGQAGLPDGARIAISQTGASRGPADDSTGKGSGK
ncbi:MAG TPA: efflux RND transporter periplasmic adaptor subunit [Vicinamibacterales bacterium]|nr:efflux RND transporter periplasmic adaptor subunit [Vicinamibacterales bacterium]